MKKALLLFVGGLAITAAANASVTSCADEDESGVEWLVYENEEYGYSIRYPEGYKVVEAKPRRETDSIWGAEVLAGSEHHKVTFIEIEYEMWYGSFEISVRPDEERAGLMEWIENWLEREEIALTEPDRGDSTIFGSGAVNIDGRPAIKLHFFNYDHVGIELFVENEGYIYNLSFAGANPNDPNVDEHKAIYSEMIESFMFER